MEGDIGKEGRGKSCIEGERGAGQIWKEEEQESKEK